MAGKTMNRILVNTYEALQKTVDDMQAMQKIYTGAGGKVEAMVSMDKTLFKGAYMNEVSFDASPDRGRRGLVHTLVNNGIVDTIHSAVGIPKSTPTGKTIAEISREYSAQRKAMREARNLLNSRAEEWKKLAQMDGLSESQLETVRKSYNAMIDSERDFTTEQLTSYLRQGLDYTKRFKDYVMNEGYTGRKIALYGGMYAAGSVGLRYLNGGGITYNNEGRRDIAGIPML